MTYIHIDSFGLWVIFPWDLDIAFLITVCLFFLLFRDQGKDAKELECEMKKMLCIGRRDILSGKKMRKCTTKQNAIMEIDESSVSRDPSKRVCW